MRNIYVIPPTGSLLAAKAGIQKRTNRAQSTIEFTFAVVAIMLLIYGMVQVFRWTGLDLANRRVAHDTSLTAHGLDGKLPEGDPAYQLNADFVRPLPMGAIYHGSLTNAD